MYGRMKSILLIVAIYVIINMFKISFLICFKIFKATVFSIRNDALPKATPGWVITDEEDIDWVGEVFNQETEIF